VTIISHTWHPDCQQLLEAILIAQRLPGRCFWSSRNLVTIFYVQFDEVSNTLLDRLLNLLDGVACHQAKKGLGHTTGVARTHGTLEYWYLKFS